MKLDDPELLRKPVGGAAMLAPYVHKTLYCRNGYHHRCTMASCLCECHSEASKQLAHQLQEQGAVRVDGRHPKCTVADCDNRVETPTSLFCPECAVGRIPAVRRKS